jgi:hypothetical protein
MSLASSANSGTKRTCRLHCAMSALKGGQSGKHLLALSFSGFDPLQAFGHLPPTAADAIPEPRSVR